MRVTLYVRFLVTTYLIPLSLSLSRTRKWIIILLITSTKYFRPILILHLTKASVTFSKDNEGDLHESYIEPLSLCPMYVSI